MSKPLYGNEIEKLKQSFDKTSKLFDEISKCDNSAKSYLTNFEKLNKSIEQMSKISGNLVKKLKKKNKITDDESEIETIIISDSETENDLETDLMSDLEIDLESDKKKNLATNSKKNCDSPNFNQCFFSRFFNNFSSAAHSKSRKRIIITGSTQPEITNQLISKLFQIENFNLSESLITNEIFEIYVETNLCKASFDETKFSHQCKKMLSEGLDNIICIGNLNPRPETLVDDLNKLLSVFGTSVCREKVIFVFTSSQPRSLEKIRSSFKSKNNKIITDLRIKNNIDKFLNEKIWYFNQNDVNSLVLVKKHYFEKNKI